MNTSIEDMSLDNVVKSAFYTSGIDCKSPSSVGTIHSKDPLLLSLLQGMATFPRVMYHLSTRFRENVSLCFSLRTLSSLSVENKV